MKKIRIFISSPSDVQQERVIARNVIDELNRRFSQHAVLEVLMWEDFPLTVDSTFQEGINYFLEEDIIDIAIFILWSRLGTPLCTRFQKSDGTPYQSGTEYEFDLMMNLFKEKGSPRILTYVKKSEEIPNATNLGELKEFLRQKDLVDAFLQEHFRDEETKSNYAYLQFGEHTSFEQKLRTHLTELVKKIVGNVFEVREWEGNPYVGLNSFTYDQSSIFFGRKQLLYETVSQIIDRNDNSIKRSLLLLGESGSGKSSFVKAGLLPFFCKEREKGYVIVSPAMFSGNMYNGLIDLIVQYYSFLAKDPFIEEIREKIDEHTNFKHLAHALDTNPHEDTIFYIDQFEELFTDAQISEEEQKKVILLLQGIVSTQRLPLFVSMRNDFYNRLAAHGGLSKRKEHCIVVDIPTIGIQEIVDIVSEPARKACLKWELDDEGNTLNKKIIKDATAIKDLPLIEFALSELYKLRDKEDCLTFAAYDKIGGLNGAIVQYVNAFYQSLNDSEKKALSEMLGFVIAVSSAEKNTYVRKTSLQKNVQHSDVHKALLAKLIHAHIFISGKDHTGEATFTIAHEVLIEKWNVINNWVQQQKEYLISNTHYEQRAQHWIQDGKPPKDLIHDATALLEAEYFYYNYQKLASEDTNAFLLASLKKDVKKGLVALGIISLLSFLGIVVLIGGYYGNKWYGENNFQTDVVRILTEEAVLLLIVPLLTIPIFYSVLKYLGKPKYKTIQCTLPYWVILFVPLFVYGFSDPISIGFIFLLVVIAGLIISYNCRELIRRKKWNNNKFVFTRFDKFVYRAKPFFTTVVMTTVMILLVTIGYLAQLEEKNEKLKMACDVTDKLFLGLNNLSSQLSGEDKVYIDELHLDYLYKLYGEENLQDTIYDERELPFAACLFKLSFPNLAVKYLYYNTMWSDYLALIPCLMHMGRYKLAESVLEDYVEKRKQIDYVLFFEYNTANLIWEAEKLGRFDLAEELYKTIDSIGWESVEHDSLFPPIIINRAHIYLAKGYMDSAVRLYQSAINNAQYNMPDYFTQSIKQDFHTFSKFGALSDERLQKGAELLGIPFIPAYSEKDTSLTKQLHQRLYGIWRYQYTEGTSTICFDLSFDSTDQLARYCIRRYTPDNPVSEMDRFVSLIDFSYNPNGNGIIWDEFCPRDDDNSWGIMEFNNDTSFNIRVLSNGNPQDSNSIRTYTKIWDVIEMPGDLITD